MTQRNQLVHYRALCRRLQNASGNANNTTLLGVELDDHKDQYVDPEVARASKYNFAELKAEYEEGVSEGVRMDVLKTVAHSDEICSDMNIIKEGLRDPRGLTSLLEDILSSNDVAGRYFALKIMVTIAGKKGFENDKLAALVPLIKVIE